MDLRQLPEWGEWLGKLGWTSVKIRMINGRTTPAYIRKMPILPVSVLKVQRFASELDEKELKDIKRTYKVVFTSLEPISIELATKLEKMGYRYDKVPFLPAKTLVIDLTKSEKALTEELSENVRRILRKKTSIKIVKISAEEFYTGWKKWSPTMILTKGQFDKMVGVFGDKLCFWASKNETGISSAIMEIMTRDSAHYYQTWTSNLGRMTNGQFYLVWDRIKAAKKLGKKQYDFEGIYDERYPLKNWRGFTEFKMKFGGRIVTYPGCLVAWF